MIYMKYVADNCGYCGLCVSVCPREILELKENKLSINNGCDECGNCKIVCPLGAFTLEDHK